jgi:hypothetical protein
MMTPTLTGGASARAEESTKGDARTAAVPDNSARRFTPAEPNEWLFDIAFSPNFLIFESLPHLAARQTRRLPQHDQRTERFRESDWKCRQKIRRQRTSFRGDAKHRTRNLEIPGLVLRTIPE